MEGDLKYHNLAIWRGARLDEMVKKQDKEKFILHAIIPALFLFSESFIV